MTGKSCALARAHQIIRGIKRRKTSRTTGSGVLKLCSTTCTLSSTNPNNSAITIAVFFLEWKLSMQRFSHCSKRVRCHQENRNSPKIKAVNNTVPPNIIIRAVERPKKRAEANSEGEAKIAPATNNPSRPDISKNMRKIICFIFKQRSALPTHEEQSDREYLISLRARPLKKITLRVQFSTTFSRNLSLQSFSPPLFTDGEVLYYPQIALTTLGLRAIISISFLPLELTQFVGNLPKNRGVRLASQAAHPYFSGFPLTSA